MRIGRQEPLAEDPGEQQFVADYTLMALMKLQEGYDSILYTWEQITESQEVRRCISCRAVRTMRRWTRLMRMCILIAVAMS